MVISALRALTYNVVLVLFSGCAAVNQPVYKVPENNDCSPTGVKDGKCSKFDGVPYVLPRTTLKITVPVITTVEQEATFVGEARGIYAAHGNNGAPCKWDKTAEDKNKCSNKDFLSAFNEKDVCIKLVRDEAKKLGITILVGEEYGGAPTSSSELGDLTLTADAEPDPQQLYFVEVKAGVFEHRNLDITLGTGGVLTDITAATENKTAEFVTKTLGSVIGVAAKVAYFAERLGSDRFRNLNDANENKACNTRSRSIYKDISLRALKELGSIEKFPSVRNNLLIGANSNVSADNLTLRLKELDSKNANSRAMFEGKKKEKTVLSQVSVLPNLKEGNIVFAKFSVSCGLYRTEDQPNDVVFFTTAPLDDDKKCEGKPLNIGLSMPQYLKRDVSLPARISNALDTTGSNTRGFYYRIPETARVVIDRDHEELVIKDVSIAQFGKIASLPSQTGSSNVTYKATLDPVTGMLLKVSITSEPANTSAASNVIDPMGDYLKARKDAKDELVQLQREEAILKTKKSIKDLKDSMGQ